MYVYVCICFAWIELVPFSLSIYRMKQTILTHNITGQTVQRISSDHYSQGIVINNTAMTCPSPQPDTLIL